MKRYPTVLTIAGSDSGGGAGIQADLKTVAALGAYGTSAITALTAQNTTGVRAIHAVPPEFLRQQLEAVFEDFTIDAVKIGMVNTAETAQVIAGALADYQPRFVVFDPVMVSTSGSRLIREDAVDALWQELLTRADLITPNIDEAEILVSEKITDLKSMQHAAGILLEKGCKAVLLKGGHLAGPVIRDVLALQNTGSLVLESDYIRSPNVHGTGCTLSSAIATYVALGHSLTDAVVLAHQYVAGAIGHGRDVITGHGPGPLNHSFSPLPMQVIS
ncbi:bifunctional hydroxymethylpyrimidine kinase/phosphomethylpyrimidine kinase [Dyadobacter sandarakinus]|uniref:hydroxymethylpyrimidine kinase n=1 Tax=Dyadobacter sandarakinus TaxID=2747268 RepID=A0ABX7IDG5_9BACT|nr:bifunctional hydroxymethylpyrimidine kinase/phosphomethylpyrimidine kinase [Dyadobacter sandarakinus]